MKISFICNYIYLNDGWSPFDKRIGGSEEMIVETSKRLAKLGHEVQVFHNGTHGVYEDVKYRDHTEFNDSEYSDPADIVVNVNYPQLKHHNQILWTSLTEHPDLSHFKAVCYISEYAKKNTGINHDKLFWVPPGYDPDKIKPGKKVPKQCFYASSPDRGLDTLLEAWPEVVRVHPDATLLLTYGAPYTNMPGIVNLGEVSEEEMNDIYATSDIWCHPCNGGELYCMTGVKAQVAGCWPVIIPTMALAETVRYGTFSTKETYAKDLIDALSVGGPGIPCSEDPYPTWDGVVDKLLKVIEEVVK